MNDLNSVISQAMGPQTEQDRLKQIFNENRRLNFIRRLLKNNPQVIINNDGTISTHRMASMEDDRGAFAFPTIVDTGIGALTQLPARDAANYARQTGEAIRFNSPEEANWYSKNYKKITKYR